MKDRLISKTRIGQFVENAYTGQNLSGITPIGDQVLVLPDKAVETTAGGVVLPESITETHSMAAESGIIVAIGDGAWAWNMDRTRRFEGNHPEVGDRVCFVRYAGTEVIGDDGEMYRIMSDASISGIRTRLEQPGEQAA